MEPIANYIRDKRKEYDNLNKSLGMDSTQELGFRLTNCDLFINYATWYLKNNPNIHQGMTLLVRELAPTEVGLPIELYIFTNTTAWGEYERISGEVMNHMLTVVKVFDLTIFEVSSGTDSYNINLKKLN
jgi:miniconductance mechanosensitive channel